MAGEAVVAPLPCVLAAGLHTPPLLPTECVVGDLPVDLLFSTCQYVTMPPGGFQILDDKILANLDPASVKTLNGPRVTELTIQLVPSFPTFQVVLRAARHWARRRGIYSNKAGYLGGVNLAILSAWACQLYPAAAPAVVMTQMFRMLSEWPWPRSIMLCEPYQNAMLSQTVWDPVTDRNQRRATMPIITPAYPAANSTFNVGWSNLAVMHREFCRARDICIAAWAQVKHRGSAGARDLPADLWEPLFRPSEFFVEFDLYLAIDVWVDDGDEEAMSRWQNYVESRVREVVRCLEAERLALEFVYNWPKPVEWVRKVHEDEKALGPARVSAQRIARAEAEREAKKQAAAQEAGAEAKAQAAKPGQKRKRGAASEEEKVAADAGVGTGSPEESGPDPRADPEDGDEQKMATFFVGLALDEARLRNRSLDLRRVDGLFTRALKLKYRASLQPSMHVEERLLSWRELPAEAFGSEGRAAAAARRAALKSVELAQGGPSWRKHALPISKEAKVQSGGQGYLGSGFGGQTSLTRWVSRAEGAGAGEEAAGLHPVPRAVAAAGVLSGEVPARIRENEAVQADIANAQLPFPVTLCEAAEPASASEVAVPGIPQASRDALSQAAGGALASDKMKAGLPGLA